MDETDPRHPSDADDAPERERDESDTSIPAPFAPDEDDDSPLGDTDQHSDA